jgi:omega-6 fatty acid desaturase (delta-12 desaturase)
VIFAVVIGIACLDIAWPLRLLVGILAALVHVRLFVIYHDYQHGNILQGSRVAAFFFRLYGFASLTPPSIWRHTHDHHHRNNARDFGVDSVGSYPVLTPQGFRNAAPSARFFYLVARNPLTIVFGYLTVFFWGFCVVPLATKPRQHFDAALSVIVHFGLLGTLFYFRPDIALFAVLLPWFVACAFGSYLFYAQHNYPSVKLQPGKEWDYVFAALHSSSFIRMSPVMHWFTGNIGYHHVHHLNAHIPFYRLPEAMAALEELQSPATTSLWPRDILRCLRLKLWDPEKGCLVSYREGLSGN